MRVPNPKGREANMFGSLSLFSLLHLSGRKRSGSGKFWDILPITDTGIITWVYIKKNRRVKHNDNDKQC